MKKIHTLSAFILWLTLTCAPTPVHATSKGFFKTLTTTVVAWCLASHAHTATPKEGKEILPLATPLSPYRASRHLLADSSTLPVWQDGNQALYTVGPEFQVNSYYISSDYSNPRIVGLSGGGFVITWNSNGQDGSGTGVYAQRYNSAGTKIGPEFQVNTYTTDRQQYPSVAGLSGGGFVISWQSDGQDRSGWGVYAQLYNSTAGKVGHEFQVNTYTASHQLDPSVAGLSSGGFVITWNSVGQETGSGSGYGVYAQLYNSTAGKVGSEFQVNTHTLNDQDSPIVAGLSGDGFVITWRSELQDGSGWGVYAQLYDSNAGKIGPEFRVNTYTIDNQWSSSVAALSGGRFVITWNSSWKDGSGDGVFAQLYNSTAGKIGPEFQVNTYTLNDQERPIVTGLLGGGFVITWRSELQDGSGWVVYAQLYNSTAGKVGREFQVNTYTLSDQVLPRVAGLSDGGFVISWESNGQNGNGTGVFAQRFDLGTPIPTMSPTAAPTLVPSLVPSPSIAPTAAPNTFPKVIKVIPAQEVEVDRILVITILIDDYFQDPEGDTITLQATEEGKQGLPTWLTFNADNNRLIALPTAADAGTTL